ncbi:hypothetical protein ACIGJO_25625 [Streptomyces sp. NPDC079020]|uniref:hypothetical protein n=1 Tax=Streptomyces sp. NPDC079020 TaxID=3365722 RepID=UPI0037D04C4F
MTTVWDTPDSGQGSNSRLNTARMHQGSTENADRLIAERRRRDMEASWEVSDRNNALLDQYEARALAREAERRELDEWRAEQKAEADRSKRAELGERWQAEADITASRHSDMTDELGAARQSYDQFTQRAEGDELAARIFNRIHTPWL